MRQGGAVGIFAVQVVIYPVQFSRVSVRGLFELIRRAAAGCLLIAVLGIAGHGLRAQPVEATEGRFSYAGREAGAAWREQALARIEAIRKGDFTVRVTDASGAPIAGAAVRVEEVRSAFQWGTAAPFARIVGDSPDDRHFRRVLLDLFNEVSPENDLKWPVWEGDWGQGFSHEQSLAARKWLRDHRFYIRGHNLVWPGKEPDWHDLPDSVKRLRGTPRQGEIPGLVLAHIRDITSATRGLIGEWDVVNEPFDHHALMDLFGPGIMAEWFRAAQAGAPGVPLYLNDWGNEDFQAEAAHARNTYDTAAFLKQEGAPLTGLGLQCHIGGRPTPPEHLLAALDRYASLRLPIRITEFDVNTDDEELQADYTRDFFILAFSHPAVVGIQVWGFWEKTHWRPKAAMFRTDWTEKPNARIYRSLVLDQWRTRQQGTTGAQGRDALRGFYGDYVVRVEAGGRRAERAFSLRAGEAPPVVEVTLP
jgi:endo-1,4-beta-xylanase